MPPRKAKAKGKEAPEEGCAGRAPKAVQDAYAAYRSKQDDASLEALVQLVESGTGGSAACMALTKASVLHATLRALEDEAGEAEAARLLQQAVESATHGVLRYKSAQLLSAAVKLLGLTHCSPHQGHRRSAVFQLLQHGLDPLSTSLAQRSGLDARVLPLDALAREPGVPRDTGLYLLGDEKTWWNRLPMGQWLAPEAEWLGSNRWPWEFRGGRGASFDVYLADCKAEASSGLVELGTADTLGSMVTQLSSLDEESKAGGTAAAAIEGLSRTKRRLLEDNPLYGQPLRERLVNSPGLLPAERVARLRRELKLRNDEQLKAASRGGQERVEPGRVSAEERIKQKAALRLQRKAQEAEAARVEHALARARVISSYLALHLPADASLPDLLELLEREARMPLAALQAGLERLGAQGVLAEQETQDLGRQLLYLAEEHFKTGSPDPVVAFRLPPKYGQQHNRVGWPQADEYWVALEATVMASARQMHTKMMDDADGLIRRVLDAAATVASDASEAALRLRRHVGLDLGALQAGNEPELPAAAPMPTPWGARGGRLALGTLPFLVQAQLPEMGDFEELLVGPMATAYDMQEVFSGIDLPTPAASEAQQRRQQQLQQPAASTTGSRQAGAGTITAGAGSGEAEGWAQPWETQGGPAAGSAAGSAAPGPIHGTGGYTSAGEEDPATDSDIELDLFVGRGSEASQAPDSPSSACRLPSLHGGGQPEGEEADAARQLQAAGCLAAVLHHQLACRPEMLCAYGAEHFLPVEARGEAPDAYRRAPAMQEAYRLADACLRPALLGRLLIACLAAGERVSARTHLNVVADPEELALLLEAWRSTEPLHVLLARVNGISEADAEGAVRPAVNSLMRSEGPLLAKAAANGGLEPSALLELQQAHQLDMVADLLRLLHLDAQLAQQQGIEQAAQELEQYKLNLVWEALYGLQLLHRNVRLTTQQLEAVLGYLQDLTPTLEGGYAHEHRCLDEAAQIQRDLETAMEQALPEGMFKELAAIEDEREKLRLLHIALKEHGGQQFLEMWHRAESDIRMWGFQAACKRMAADLVRAALLPIRALERLHAFVCLLVFNAFGSPEEAGLQLAGDVPQRRCVGQLVETGPQEHRAGSGGSEGDPPLLFEGCSLAVRASGLEVALGLHQDVPVEQALDMVAGFATGLAASSTDGLSACVAAGGEQLRGQPGAPAGKQGGKPAGRQGAAGAGAGGAAAAFQPDGQPAGNPCQLMAQPWHQGSVGDIVLHIASCYLALAAGLEGLVHLLRRVDEQLRGCDDVLASLRRTLDEKYNLDGYAATLLSEGLLAVADAQMQLMWQAQRAQDVCDAFFNAVRSHMHRLEAERMDLAYHASSAGDGPPEVWGLLRPVPPLQELSDAYSQLDREAQDCLDEARDALRKTKGGWKNWMAIETTQPPGQEGPGWPRQLAKPLDRLRSLLDTALLPGAAGEGGGRSVGSPPRSLLSELVDDAFLSDEEWSLSSLGSVGGLGDRRRHPAGLGVELEAGMFACLDALRDLWCSDKFQQLRRQVEDRREELRAAQCEAYRTAHLLLGLLLRSLGCVVCPADNLARCMLAHLLPERWGEALEQAEALQREAAWDELMASEAGTAAAAKKKKNKGRKGAQPAAAQATQPAADTAEAGEEGPEEQEREQEDELALLGRLQAQRKQQAAEAGAVAAAPAVPAEQQEGYQRMLREYEEAQRAQKMKQAAKPAVQQAAGRSSSQASASTTSAPHQAAAAVADTASSTGSGAAAAGGDTLAAELDAAEVDGERQHSLAALQAASQAFDWSMIEGADADASPHGDAEPAPADWQDAPSHRPAPAKARLAAEAAAASTDSWQGKPAVVDQTEQQAEQQTVAPHRAQQQQQRSAIDPNKPRVVGWDGAWVCKCGKRHSVSEACKACKAPVPCREYLKSGCPYGRTCRFSHPQFALDPPHPPPGGRRTALVANPRALPFAAEKSAADDRYVRVVSWMGEWMCPCETRHFMHHPCSTCDYPSPCRDWLRGTCKYGVACQYPHPPFDLPPGPAPPAETRVVKPREGMPVWHGSQAPLQGHILAAGTAVTAQQPAPSRTEAASTAGRDGAALTAAAVLEAAPLAAVAALAESLGVPAEGLAGLLPPEDLAAALETVQLQAVDRGQGQHQQGQEGQEQSLVSTQHAQWPEEQRRQQQQRQQQAQADIEAEAMPARLPVLPAIAAAMPAAPAGGDHANGHAEEAVTEPAHEAAGGVDMRIVGGDGSWVCSCGRLNPIARERRRRGRDVLLSKCDGCPQAGPCRQWLLGRCTSSACPYPHPPFDEACWAPAPGGTQPRAVLWEGAPRYAHSPPPEPQPTQLARQHARQHDRGSLEYLPIGPPTAIIQPTVQQQEPGDGPAAASTAAAASLGVGGEEDIDELLQIMGVSAPAAAAPSGVAGAPSSAHQAAAAAPLTFDVATPGLRNEAGEYNCFLNVIIQCLWRCADFRRQVMAWGPAVCARNPVLAALHSLFHAFAAEEAQRRAGGTLTGTAARRRLVDPSQLRQALSELPGQQFRAGEMNDAGEVLLTLYESTISTGAAAESAVNAIFGLPVEEQVKCVRCGKTTHRNSYTQFFYNIQAAALQQAGLATASRCSMGELFRQLELQHQKSCDEDVGGCGAKNSVSCSLSYLPRVFTVQLTWESHREEPQSIAATLVAIDEQVDLAELYLGVTPGRRHFKLRSMVCYYGQHYSAFIWADDLGAWLMFDDAAVSRVGGWAEVRRKCEAGRIQPSVLFYEAAAATVA